MGNKHWSTGLNDMEVAEQLQAMLILNRDYGSPDNDGTYDDAEMLEAVETFNDRLDDERDKALIATLNVYAVPHWNGETMNLTEPHLKLLYGAVTAWIERNDTGD